MKSNIHRRGFTFMEILFAVMILGVGFIMVAAMFPAALRQTQANVEVTAFNAVVAKAQNDLQAAAYMYDPSANYSFQQGTLPAGTKPTRFLDLLTGWLKNDNSLGLGEPWDYDPSNTAIPAAQVGRPYPFSFHDPRFRGRFASYMTAPTKGAKGTYNNSDIETYLWDVVRGNLISPDKREYAYVPLWSRGMVAVNGSGSPPTLLPDASLNLFIFPVRSRAKPLYDPYLLTNATPATPNPACDTAFDYANLDPQVIEINYYPPPTSNVNPDVPNGVLKVAAFRQGAGSLLQDAYTAALSPVNPCAEGAYVVVSDSDAHILASATNPYPKALNGMIFKLGQEVADSNGNPGTSNGQCWAVAEVDNLPAEQPFNVTKPSQIGAMDMQGQGIFALVIGRQPDPADPIQHSSSRSGSQFQYLNRTGPTQELGVILTSVPLK